MSGLDARKLTDRLSGLTVASVSPGDSGALLVHFTDGTALVVEPRQSGLVAAIHRPGEPGRGALANRPTRRQREYLDFITKYMGRYGIAPAEADIQKHFLVSAPSVNQMMQMLERRGFIVRRRDPFTGQAIPRSIRIAGDST